MAAFFESRTNPFPDDWQGQVPPAGFFSFINWQLRGYWPWVILVFVLSVFYAWVEVSFIALVGQVIDWLASARAAENIAAAASSVPADAATNGATTASESATALIPDAEQRAVIGGLIWRILLLAIGGLAFGLLVFQPLYGNFPMAARWRGHRHLLSQSYAFFQDEFAGRVSQKLMQSSLATREVVIKVIDVLAYIGAWFIGAIGITAMMDPLYLLPFVGWLVGFALIFAWLLPELTRRSERTADAISEMVGRITDSYSNILTVKLFAQGHQELDCGREGMAQQLGAFHRSNRVITVLSGLRDVLNTLFVIAVLLIGLLTWSRGTGTPGELAVALGLALRINGLGQWLMWELQGLADAVGTLRDGIRMLSEKPSVVDAPDASTLTVKSGAIEFDKVRFHYGQGHGTFEQLSLSIAAGEKVGIVGRSGAGKSTLTHLLLRLFDTEGGTVRIDGQNIAEVSQDSLRRQIAMVSQDTSLMHRSIRDNIAYGRPEASDADVIEAARRAHAHDFIEELEDSKGRRGYQAHAGERGVKLSGGQRQRIAIARVFLKDAPILVLDEATSALDSGVEAAIQENLAELMQGKTVIAIAHRLSTIAAMDRLVVLDKGEIVETGTHDALVAAGGLYAQLWAHQSGGFLGVDTALHDQKNPSGFTS
ncbi:MAG: multidrug ABC transporter ATP-binding protein [Gammaproteobacteria bacterium]|nr:MAG: multidrug ABC transporter ATP-binding protein [Gammaproteobacteria bacterium]